MEWQYNFLDYEFWFPKQPSSYKDFLVCVLRTTGVAFPEKIALVNGDVAYPQTIYTLPSDARVTNVFTDAYEQVIYIVGYRIQYPTTYKYQYPLFIALDMVNSETHTLIDRLGGVGPTELVASVADTSFGEQPWDAACTDDQVVFISLREFNPASENTGIVAYLVEEDFECNLAMHVTFGDDFPTVSDPSVTYYYYGANHHVLKVYPQAGETLFHYIRFDPSSPHVVMNNRLYRYRHQKWAYVSSNPLLKQRWLMSPGTFSMYEKDSGDGNYLYASDALTYMSATLPTLPKETSEDDLCLDIYKGQYWGSSTEGVYKYNTMLGWVDITPAPYTEEPDPGANWFRNFGHAGKYLYTINDAYFGTGVGGIYYTPASGIYVVLDEMNSKLAVAKDGSYVFVATKNDLDVNDYWRVPSTLSEVDLIDTALVSGAPALVKTFNDGGVVLGGAFQNALLKYSTDYYTAHSVITIPSGIELVDWSTGFELPSGEFSNLLIATANASGWVDSAKAFGITTTIGSGESIVYINTLNFVVLGTTNSGEKTFLGADTPVAAIVDYTTDNAGTLIARDTGLPVATITDLDFA